LVYKCCCAGYCITEGWKISVGKAGLVTEILCNGVVGIWWWAYLIFCCIKDKPKIINKKEHYDNVKSLEIIHLLIGISVGMFFEFFIKFDITTIGWLLAFIIIFYFGITIIIPLAFRYFFLIIGFSTGVFLLYVLMNIIYPTISIF
jgi:hypothetical protein